MSGNFFFLKKHKLAGVSFKEDEFERKIGENEAETKFDNKKNYQVHNSRFVFFFSVHDSLKLTSF